MPKSKVVAIDQPVKPKPSLSINENDYKEIKGLKLDEYVTVTATGKIISLDKNTYSDNKFSARIELEDLQISSSKKQQQANVSKMFGLKNLK